MEKEYYLLDGDERTGPFTYDELVQKGVDVNTQLSTPLNDKWQYASEIPEFIEYFKSLGIHFPTEDNLANFGMRALAFAIDYFPLYIIAEVLALKFNWVTIPADFTFGKTLPPSLMMLYLWFTLFYLLYRTVTEASPLKGTIGKKICKLAVVDINGNAPSILASLGRNVGVVLSIMLWVPFLSMFFNEYRQNWYDSLANTYVVKTN